MTVKELINELKNYDENAECVLCGFDLSKIKYYQTPINLIDYEDDRVVLYELEQIEFE